MKSSRIISLALCIVMLLSTLSFFGVAADTEETTILACSDFQAHAGNASGMSTMRSILNIIKKDGVKSADGFFCCGDYDYDSYGVLENTKDGLKFVKMALSGFVKEEDMVLVQGNHDVYPSAESGLSPSGANDSDTYGVYVIHEEDYMWYNDDETKIKKTAQKLINYLNEKLETGYEKPIFVLSHLPLHYSMRTIVDGDAKYASYIFNALNEAAQKGLNIVYMFGHDHSNGWDDYLGGASVFLKRGDKILLAKNSAYTKEYKTLNFTYMNAGYVGYYNNHNDADDALTMTVIKIKGDKIEFVRYDKSGRHNLKSEGVTNAYKNESGYDPNKTVYPSPQTELLTKVSDTTPIKELISIEVNGIRYNRVDSSEDLVSGNRYILVHNSSPDHIMIPEVVTKSDSAGAKRTGLNVTRTEAFGDEAAFGDYKQYEWVLTKTDNGWYLGNGSENVLFSSTAKEKITATFDSVGSKFQIKGTGGSFVFQSGANSLNYNARGLINGYSSDPAKFYIYEYAGHSLNVKNGSALQGSEKVEWAQAGQEIKVVANKAPEGMEFDSWSITFGSLEIPNLQSPEITFNMVEGGVALEAKYKPTKAQNITETPSDSKPTSVPKTTEDLKDSDKKAVIISVIAVSGMVFAAAVYIIIKKTPRHK